LILKPYDNEALQEKIHKLEIYLLDNIENSENNPILENNNENEIEEKEKLEEKIENEFA
jgi:hypothetical protein